MNKIPLLTLTLGSILTLSGCAGTSSDFECNATTSDTCMTIEQANEKAKRLEEGSGVKPDVAALPRLAEGNFRTVSAQPLATPTAPVTTIATASVSTPRQNASFPRNVPVTTPPVATVTYQPRPVSISTHDMIVDPRPLRVGEKTAGLWIAPYIDTQDVYHQPTRVFFVVKPSAWGQPRVH
ncbi:type IV conjugative transfer system lipoprotein TraV [Serratia fonticola]|uniref:type IV conjugative transfer system lipoprotein TraV n=1 Tax=Serratia fonticola TaxID=47917 RepID=UPI0015C5E8A9|nr:type IV conjugative transfer system lipoprotein TraV [Serratia fonticola]NXZ90002.1 type IV conjugative transfer system lipoprotein TraV [Serratia fonticola]NYA46098.1 type IV conjugative transfer system lipoprotein TraV [Serratia fonticola]